MGSSPFLSQTKLFFTQYSSGVPVDLSHFPRQGKLLFPSWISQQIVCILPSSCNAEQSMLPYSAFLLSQFVLFSLSDKTSGNLVSLGNSLAFDAHLSVVLDPKICKQMTQAEMPFMRLSLEKRKQMLRRLVAQRDGIFKGIEASQVLLQYLKILPVHLHQDILNYI